MSPAAFFVSACVSQFKYIVIAMKIEAAAATSSKLNLAFI